MKLINIRLPITQDDKRIDSRSSYLVKYNGRWSAGTFYKERYGWNYAGHYDAGCQYDYPGWQKIYRIKE
jgi:hypothetical protein